MAIQVIPVFNEPAYTQRVEMDGTEYVLDLFFNEREWAWYLSIADVDGVAILSSLKLVVGFPLLRKNAGTRRPPGELYALDMTGADRPASLTDFGKRVRLVYLDAAELGR